MPQNTNSVYVCYIFNSSVTYPYDVWASQVEQVSKRVVAGKKENAMETEARF